MIDPGSIIYPGSDPLAENPSYTITVTSSEGLAVRDAVTLMWMLARGAEIEPWMREPQFLDEANAVADRLTELMNPHTRRVGAWIRLLSDASQRYN